jgi:hypothetical protein
VFKRFLAVMAATAAVLGASAGAALAEYPPTTQTGAVSSTTIVVGGHVDFAGGGFGLGSKVTILVNTAVYATVTASGASSSALGTSSAHFATAAFARPVAQSTAAVASFKVRVTLDKLGKFTLTGQGVDASGAPRLVKATVLVIPATAKQSSGSTLPFTGSAVLVPGLIIGLTMMAGGFVLLTSVRSRRAGARS